MRRLPTTYVATLLVLMLGSLSAAPIPIEVPVRAKPVDFESEVLPILRANCTACHNERKHEIGRAHV